MLPPHSLRKMSAAAGEDGNLYSSSPLLHKVKSPCYPGKESKPTNGYSSALTQKRVWLTLQRDKNSLVLKNPHWHKAEFHDLVEEGGR